MIIFLFKFRRHRVSVDVNIADLAYSVFGLDFTRERLIIVCEGRGIIVVYTKKREKRKEEPNPIIKKDVCVYRI